MTDNSKWIEAKAKARLGQDFVKTLFEFSGYKVMNYGIENHNQSIIKEISGKYTSDTNIRLMCMPDFVVVDSEAKIAELVEVKYRQGKRDFDEYSSNFWFKYSRIKNYLEFWNDMTMIIVTNVEPYCLCIQMKDIDWCKHFKEKKEGNRKGYTDEIWNFRGIYKKINEIFPNVNDEHMSKTLETFPIAIDKDKSDNQ